MQYRYVRNQGVVVFICFLFFFLQVNVTVSVSSGDSIIYVDDDNTDGPWDGSAEHPYQCIQDGVNAADIGDTVFVNSGMYIEQVVINKSITLQGEDKNTTVIDGDKVDDVIHVNGNGTTIGGFTLQNARNGLFSDDSGIDIRGNNNLITDNIIQRNYQYGVYVRALHSNNTITGNLFYSNLLGLKLEFTSYSTISDNTFVDNYYGFEIGFCDHVEISNNTIVDSFYVFRAEDMFSSCIMFNTVGGESANGMVLTDSDANSISNNNLSNDVRSPWSGIGLDGSSNNRIEGNIVDDFGENGISITSGGGNSIRSNTIKNNKDGVTLTYTENNMICLNTIEDNNEYGIFLQYENNNNIIYHNNFVNNSKHAKVGSGTNQWDNSLKGNYWDDYEERYPDARRTLRGVWNTPYELDEVNVDRFPLVDEYTGSNKNKTYFSYVPLYLLRTIAKINIFFYDLTKA